MAETDEPLFLVPIPSLIATLVNLENTKGCPLTEAQVLETRDKCPCVAMPLAAMQAVEERRGYLDVDPENVWEDWLSYKSSESDGYASHS